MKAPLMNSLPADDNEDIASKVRHLLRRCPKGALGTVGPENDLDHGAPHVSLVLIATDAGGAPIMLLSKLALHSQYLLRDDRAGLLLDGTDGLDEPLTGPRLSLTGRVSPYDGDIGRRRFLARHQSAGQYADFGDFSFYRFDIDKGHYVGGFGAIHDFSPEDLMTECSNATALFDNEADIIRHMNEDHGDVIELLAHKLQGAEGGPWRLTSIDPEGCDLMAGFRLIRQRFSQMVLTPDDARRAFIDLANFARKEV